MSTSQKPGGNRRLAILNRDDSSYEYLAGITEVATVSYGIESESDVTARGVGLSDSGSVFSVVGADLRVDIDSPLPGRYNVSNCLAAICATVLGAGVPPEAAAKAIGSMAGIPGRMERINVGQDFTAIVDFAHTPNALKEALTAGRDMLARSSTPGRLIAVLGSAGLRDRGKRRMMAQTSVDLADLSVFTAEDPRSESLDAILGEMAEGARSGGGVEGKDYWRVPDRGEALRLAVNHARAGDLVIACGKGHEQSMCFGSREHAWDDRIALSAALCERFGIEGPRMPYLPTRDQAEEEWLKAT
jgi:UDP-N-acetylmuramoyl-L-alanyl-D-glutamate--2,6-diaminopimelate ligase